MLDQGFPNICNSSRHRSLKLRGGSVDAVDRVVLPFEMVARKDVPREDPLRFQRVGAAGTVECTAYLKNADFPQTQKNGRETGSAFPSLRRGKDSIGFESSFLVLSR